MSAKIDSSRAGERVDVVMENFGYWLGCSNENRTVSKGWNTGRGRIFAYS